MNKTLKNKIKQTIETNPGSFIFYHENNEWSIYPSSVNKRSASMRTVAGSELLDGNDYRNRSGFAPELVVALAELLGIQVISSENRERDMKNIRRRIHNVTRC